ncbi:hypothetical protein [Frankia sp. CcWB3]
MRLGQGLRTRDNRPRPRVSTPFLILQVMVVTRAPVPPGVCLQPAVEGRARIGVGIGIGIGHRLAALPRAGDR